ncbi:MAG TPA: FxLYD domain-containing protein [Bryobacteraceae bacterium]|nr:FxLYD domain-containing protein [Bryobacteraceae bacterium]
MAKSFRQIVESVVFAGMKPGMTPSQSRRARLLGPLRRPLERFLNAAAPDDPFYLTNRSWGQRIKLWAVIALPVILVAAVIGFGVLGRIHKRDREPKEMSAPQIAAKMLPDLNQPMDLNVNNQFEVIEARIERGEPRKLVGSVRNRTDRAIDRAELVFDLTDVRGSRLGAVSVTVQNVQPQQTVAFQLPLEQSTAAFALKRSQ